MSVLTAISTISPPFISIILCIILFLYSSPCSSFSPLASICKVFYYLSLLLSNVNVTIFPSAFITHLCPSVCCFHCCFLISLNIQACFTFEFCLLLLDILCFVSPPAVCFFHSAMMENKNIILPIQFFLQFTLHFQNRTKRSKHQVPQTFKLFNWTVSTFFIIQVQRLNERRCTKMILG